MRNLNSYISKHSQHNFFKSLVSILAIIIIGYLAGSEFVPRLSERWADVGQLPEYILIIRRSLILFAIIIIYRSTIKRRVGTLLSILILSIGVQGVMEFKFFTFYADSASILKTYGHTTDLNRTSMLLVLCAAVLFIQDKSWLKLLIRNKLFLPFIALMLCCLITQTYHLGIKAGFGLTYVRIVQPMIFIFLVSYIARTKEGLKNIFLCLGLSALICIIFRYINFFNMQTVSDRVSYLGSWTIYGTILAATIPFVFCLLVTTKYPVTKIVFIGIGIIIITEIFLTKTRGAIFALPLLGLFVATRHSRKYVVLTVLLLLISSLIFEISIEKLSGGRIYSLDPNVMLADRNWISRVDINMDAVAYILQHPFQGLGLGAPTSPATEKIAFWVYNPYLHWGVSMGVIAMLAFVVIMYRSIVQSIRNIVQEGQKFKIYQWSIFISLCVWVLNQFTTGDSLTYLHPIEAILCFYALIGMILGQQISREHGDFGRETVRKLTKDQK